MPTASCRATTVVVAVFATVVANAAACLPAGRALRYTFNYTWKQMNNRDINPPNSIQFNPIQYDWLRDLVNAAPKGSKITITSLVKDAVDAARTKKTVAITIVKTKYDGAALDYLRQTNKVVDKFKDRVRDVKATSLFGSDECRKKSWELVTEADHLQSEIRRLIKLVGGLSPAALEVCKNTAKSLRKQIDSKDLEEVAKQAAKELLTSLEILGLSDETDSVK